MDAANCSIYNIDKKIDPIFPDATVTQREVRNILGCTRYAVNLITSQGETNETFRRAVVFEMR